MDLAPQEAAMRKKSLPSVQPELLAGLRKLRGYSHRREFGGASVLVPILVTTKFVHCLRSVPHRLLTKFLANVRILCPKLMRIVLQFNRSLISSKGSICLN